MCGSHPPKVLDRVKTAPIMPCPLADSMARLGCLVASTGDDAIGEVERSLNRGKHSDVHLLVVCISWPG